MFAGASTIFSELSVDIACVYSVFHEAASQQKEHHVVEQKYKNRISTYIITRTEFSKGGLGTTPAGCRH